jgi:flagellar hook-associated protein 1 FlgK
MPISTFLGLETALRGVLAQQQALDVTGHNIANASTVGYTRQRADMAATPALRLWPDGQVGTGVEVTQYERVRDDFIDVQLRAQTMIQGYHQARQDGLQQVELATNEPGDNGISAQLNKFWSAWQDVSNNPEDVATRQALIQSGAALSNSFQSLHTQLATIDSQTQTDIGLTVTDLNSTVSSIASLDQEIMAQVASGQTPSNDLLDQRDVLLDRLGGVVNMSSTKQPDGSVTVKVGSFTLLSGGVATSVASVASFGNDPTTGQPNLTSGKLAGLVDLDTTVQGYQTQLDAVASSLISTVNGLQTSGYTLYGTAATGKPFFSGTGAGDLAVDSGIVADPKLIAASDAANQPGNGNNAIAIGELSGNASIDGAYTALITTMGSDSQTAQRNASNATALVDALQNRRDSVSAVSIDEEMTNLLRYQRGYQASARALTAMDDMIDTLISRTGRVGL